VEVKVEDQTYTGSEITPPVEVRYNGVLLVEGVDYLLSYENNIEVSTDSGVKPTVIVKGINRYFGTVSETFEILPAQKPSDPPAPPEPIDPDDGSDTGDSTNMTPWIVLMSVSTIGLIAVIFLRKKRNDEAD
jgi:LPXTG-motif cell wall-anchored protein